MENNENFIYINSEKVEMPFIPGIDPVDPSDIWLPVTIELEEQIPIPEGFQSVPGQTNTIKLTFDKHDIIPVVIKMDVPVDLNFVDVSGNVVIMNTASRIYQVKLVGSLYYNVVASNIQPIESSDRKRTSINSFGSIPLDGILGYVSDLNHIPDDLRKRLIFNIIIDSINRKGEELVTATEIHELITVSVTMVIAVNLGPIS